MEQNNIRDLLLILQRYLEEGKSNIIERLQPGLNKEYINGLFASVKYIGNDLYDLFAWRNGVPSDGTWVIGETDFCSWGLLIALEDLINIYDIYVTTELHER